ncbi:MAG: hypothetical protein NUV74_10330 [Candidatus Brocadiaceae bacterium]|nr:hypothetical protein [Candidatus Brocadiaceae bacterium]
MHHTYSSIIEKAYNSIDLQALSEATMSDKDFYRFSEFIHSEYGIKLPLTKKTMLEGRFRKRLASLGMRSFSEYCDYVFSPEGIQKELAHMVDAVTTNKTDFFREPACFDYLVRTALPELMNTRCSGLQKGLSLWSAGCSSGEEPYTLSIVLSEFAEGNPGFRFSILATDISIRMLDTAIHAVYGEDRVEPVPDELREKYLMVSKNHDKHMVRIAPELRSLVTFKRLNLMENNFGMDEPFEIIFCRNVIIYFDKETQERLLNKFCRHLIPGGYLVVGHSEILTNMNIPLTRVCQTVYRKSV